MLWRGAVLALLSHYKQVSLFKIISLWNSWLFKPPFLGATQAGFCSLCVGIFMSSRGNLFTIRNDRFFLFILCKEFLSLSSIFLIKAFLFLRF